MNNKKGTLRGAFLCLKNFFKFPIDKIKTLSIIIFNRSKELGIFSKGDKKVDGLDGVDFYKSALQELIFETQDLGILDLIYKILIQAKN